MIVRLAFKAGKLLAYSRRTPMRRFDLSPLYKTSIGFDHLANILDQLANVDTDTGFPPYNIERLGENVYRISMAVAGFGDNDLSIEVKEGTLTVRGEKKGEDKVRQYIHQGIAARNFERRFRLADYVEVSAATLEHGLLHVDLKRELPEAMKPRTISITKGQTPRVIDGGAASKPQAA
jgi:molecular chaperone IbpA